MTERIDLQLMQGAIDVHTHQGPSVFHRHHFMDVARNAHELGMRAMVFKSHHTVTVDRAAWAQATFPELDVFASIVLNYANGGINAFAVDHALRLGARVVWMPTIDTVMQQRHFGAIGGYGSKQSFDLPSFYGGAEPIRIADQQGVLAPGLEDVLDLVKEHDVVLAVGHVTPDETFALVEAAAAKGITKILIDHPYLPFTELGDVAQQKALTESGATLNYAFSQLTPRWYCISPPEMVEHMRLVGVDNIVISSDLGQLHNPLPADGIRQFVQILLEEGVSADEIETMLKRNTARLLYPEH